MKVKSYTVISSDESYLATKVAMFVHILTDFVLETFDIWVTILAIENPIKSVNSGQSLLPDNQEGEWTAFAILEIVMAQYYVEKIPILYRSEGIFATKMDMK